MGEQFRGEGLVFPGAFAGLWGCKEGNEADEEHKEAKAADDVADDLQKQEAVHKAKPEGKRAHDDIEYRHYQTRHGVDAVAEDENSADWDKHNICCANF